jgi:ribosomal protein L7/L12
MGIFSILSSEAALSVTDRRRLIRLENKLDLILEHLGIKYVEVNATSPEGLSQDVQALADNPSQKLEAIKLHREETGVGLREAKRKFAIDHTGIIPA